MNRTWTLLAVAAVLLHAPAAVAQSDSEYIRANYTRKTYLVPVRDGVKLHTIVYSPKDAGQKYPLLMTRTPYGIRPYDEQVFRDSLGPNRNFIREGYHFVYQDVRGCYMSEGVFENMRPQLAPGKGGPKDTDESTDTYDTIEFLLKNVPNHNGRVGLFGISYPGFYSSAGMVNAHPALKAVSPQAPIADWFFDDFHHHGTTYLAHAVGFFGRFGKPRPEPAMTRPPAFDPGSRDGYQFYLNFGSLKNVNPRYFKNEIAYWNEFIVHPNYDDWWQARNLLPHLKKVAPAVMTVGGWYDAEDLYGTFKTYQAIEKQNPGIFNVLVVGPWSHGQWTDPYATALGNISFGTTTGDFFQKNIELPFFNHFLKDRGKHNLPEAFVFETGTNRWRQFDHWPPQQVKKQKLYLAAGGKLDTAAPTADGSDEYVSDPARPVPYTESFSIGMTQAHMTDDQRYAARRPDVLVYQTAPLTADKTLAGPLLVDLHVSTTGTDADFIVKVIDVFPDDMKGFVDQGRRPLAGYQMLVRHEAMRGRFRNSYEKPEPFTANEPARIKLELQDVLHTFKKGHRIMVQVSSTWFPLIDRNPQKYVPNIFAAEDGDFIRATQRVHRSAQRPSSIEVGILPAGKN
jgi:putative CocE/NonD family hydrolase